MAAALSGREAEVEACLCEWMKPAADEEALATRDGTQRLQEVQDFHINGRTAYLTVKWAFKRV